jgi:hypothetical protein
MVTWARGITYSFLLFLGGRRALAIYSTWWKTDLESVESGVLGPVVSSGPCPLFRLYFRLVLHLHGVKRRVQCLALGWDTCLSQSDGQLLVWRQGGDTCLDIR